MIVKEWEQVADCTFRLKVDGGWLYRYHTSAMTFAPEVPFREMPPVTGYPPLGDPYVGTATHEISEIIKLLG